MEEIMSEEQPNYTVNSMPLITGATINPSDLYEASTICSTVLGKTYNYWRMEAIEALERALPQVTEIRGEYNYPNTYPNTKDAEKIVDAIINAALCKWSDKQV